MNKLSMDKKIAVVSALVEGCSVRSTVRMTGVSKGAILRLLVEVGTACAESHDAALVKIFGADPDGARTYSPAQCLGIKKEIVLGNPDPKHISTSYVERQNLTMRISMRRFTRLTNAFSKKIENHMHSVALYYMYYNFVRVHQTLRVTPAMEAGISSHVWSIQEIVALGALPVMKAAA